MNKFNPPPEAGYVRVFENPMGGFVDVHENHGKQESRQNIPIALFLAARGERVHLLGVQEEAGRKNPDATRNEIIWEFKTPEGRSANAIDKALRDGSRQAACILLKLPADFDPELIEHGMYNRVQRTPAILEIAVLLDVRLFSFPRQVIVSNEFRGTIGIKK